MVVRQYGASSAGNQGLDLDNSTWANASAAAAVDNARRGNSLEADDGEDRVWGIDNTVSCHQSKLSFM